MAKGYWKGMLRSKHIRPINLGPNIGGLADALSAREREVVQLMAQGLSDAEIGQALCISLRTAEWHADNIRRKLGLHNRVQVAAWWHGLGMITRLDAFSLPTTAPATC